MADYIRYTNQGAIRSQPISGRLESALDFLPELGVTMEVFSGGQHSAEEGGARTGSTRHDHGHAADVFFYKDGRRIDWQDPEDRKVFQEIVKRGKAKGLTGFGAGDNYMQPGSMHLGFGTPAVWGSGGKGSNAPDWLSSAYGQADAISGGQGSDVAQGSDVIAGGQGTDDITAPGQDLRASFLGLLEDAPQQQEEPSLRDSFLSLLDQPGGSDPVDVYQDVAGTGALQPRITAPIDIQEAAATGRFTPDIAASTARPFTDLTGQAFESLTSGGDLGASMVPESVPLGVGGVDINIPEGVRSALGPIVDAGLTALGGVGAVGAGAAGLTGDVLEALGLPKQSAERFARDVAAAPEAFAGSPTAIPRAGVPRGQARVATEAADVIQEGAERGVRVMTSDVRQPRTFIGRWTQGAGEKIPVAGTGAGRAAQAEERVGAVRDFVSQYSDDATKWTDDVLATVSDDVFRENQRKVSKYVKMKDEAFSTVEGAGAVPVTKTEAKIDGLIAKYSGNETFRPLVSELERWKRDFAGNGDIRSLDRLRSALGDVFTGDQLSSVQTEGKKALNSLYAPLRQDIDAFVQANGGDKALTKLRVANRRLSDNMSEINGTALKSVLTNADAKPETVKRLLFSADASDVRRLYKSLSPEGRQNARAAVLHEALDKAGGLDNVSPRKFVSQLDRRAKQTGIFFTGDDRQTMEGFVRLMKATSRADDAAVAPPTGVQAVPIVGGAVATDLLGGAGAGIASLGAIGGLARLYESPAARKIFVQMSKVKPGSKREQDLMQRALAELERVGPATARAGQAAYVGTQQTEDQ